tara:strand:- start:546 stop:686 length:141 start_codon:yes stop_codon:yes gene_type:complete
MVLKSSENKVKSNEKKGKPQTIMTPIMTLIIMKMIKIMIRKRISQM